MVIFIYGKKLATVDDKREFMYFGTLTDAQLVCEEEHLF